WHEGWNHFAFPLVVRDAGHWALEGAGLHAGDLIARAHGYEVDQTDENTPPGTEILADSPVLSYFGNLRRAQMTLRKQGEALILAAGGTDFVRTLASRDLFDPRAGRIVANVLYRALGRPAPLALTA